MRRVETAAGVLLLALGLVLAGAGIALGWRILNTPKPTTTSSSSPSGVWAGLVDDLPSGRLVECVFARDPSGSVAVTCDWQNAVIRGRP